VAAPAETAKVDMLKLATQLATPVQEKRKTRASAVEARKMPRSGTDARTLTSLKAQTELDPAPGQIDRRASGGTVRDRATAEFRRAVGLVNQGRVAEGLDGLRAALKIDPTYDAVPHTLA